MVRTEEQLKLIQREKHLQVKRTVALISADLKERGLNSKGTKAELIERLVKALADEEYGPDADENTEEYVTQINVWHQSVARLKLLCKEEGLSQTGTKQKLVDRLVEANSRKYVDILQDENAEARMRQEKGKYQRGNLPFDLQAPRIQYLRGGGFIDWNNV